MIKLKTGVSTSLDFVKAMKERGQDVSPAFPAETLRDQLDALSDEVKVTFNSDNETVLQVVNDYEPGPVPPAPVEKVTLTLDYNGGKSQEGPEGVGSVEVELDKGTVYILTDPAADPDFVIPDGKNFDGWSTVKDDAETKVEGTSVTVNENMTLYILWV